MRFLNSEAYDTTCFAGKSRAIVNHSDTYPVSIIGQDTYALTVENGEVFIRNIPSNGDTPIYYEMSFGETGDYIDMWIFSGVDGIYVYCSVPGASGNKSFNVNTIVQFGLSPVAAVRINCASGEGRIPSKQFLIYRDQLNPVKIEWMKYPGTQMLVVAIGGNGLATSNGTSSVDNIIAFVPTNDEGTIRSMIDSTVAADILSSPTFVEGAAQVASTYGRQAAKEEVAHLQEIYSAI